MAPELGANIIANFIGKWNYKLQTVFDRAAITQAVQDWGLARDAGRWERLRSFYTPEATMYTIWFVGSAAEFVDRSIEAAEKGARAQHFTGAASIEVRADRAIVDTRMILMVRGRLHGIKVDVTCYGRYYLQSFGGATITADLPTPNSLALARLYLKGDSWL